MKTATLKQSTEVLKLILEKEISDEQLQWMLESGALSDLLDANPDGYDRDAYRKFLGLNLLNPLLIPVDTVAVPATAILFVAREHFVMNARDDAPVKISCLRDSSEGNFENSRFGRWFLGKKEQPFGGSNLRYGKLSRPSVNEPIIAELGGEEEAETTLTEFFILLREQKKSKSGPLLTNGRPNIFYIRDVSGVLRSVRACWFDGGWDVRALAVADPRAWDDNSQVFSRIS